MVDTPTKLFEYMAWGRPVIGSIKGEIEKIIKRANSGLIATPEDADSIAKQILYYYINRDKIDDHGQNGVLYVTENVRKETLLSDALYNIMKVNILNIDIETIKFYSTIEQAYIILIAHWH